MKIDAYAHIVPPRFLRRVRRLIDERGVGEQLRLFVPWLDEDPVLCDLDARWRLLDQLEDYRQVLVLGALPIEELGERELVRELAKEVNDELAELVRSYPDRFVGFAASLPLTDPDDALEEIRRSDAELGASGALISSNIGGRPLDDPRFELLFAELARRDRVIWIHPTRSQLHADYASEGESRFGIWWSLGWPYETAAAMTRLVFSGHMERYPEMKVVTHHSGGMIPHFSGRLDAVQTEDQRDAFETVFKRPVLDYYRRFYADTAMFGAPHSVRSAFEFFGPERMLFGTDMPLGGPSVIPDTIADIEALGLAPDDRERVFERNARRLLRLGE
ncbi:MAG: amidohydrolase family protein [Solirubrobacteraceae bacterium]